MTFDEVWESAPIGAVIAVSDGRAAPPGGLGSPRYNLWRSHNFGGPLTEKIDSPRRLRIRDAGNPAQVFYDVAEDVVHAFTLAE